ncbi:MAG: hypothetical protein AABZ06_10195 [Bdellovibrionota bacterium]
MSKKKNKFDLSHLVHGGYVKDGQILYYVSDPSRACRIARQPNGEYKVISDSKETMTVYAFVQQCLGQDPPDHASKWLKTDGGKTLYDLWSTEEYEEYSEAA